MSFNEFSWNGRLLVRRVVLLLDVGLLSFLMFLWASFSFSFRSFSRYSSTCFWSAGGHGGIFGSFLVLTKRTFTQFVIQHKRCLTGRITQQQNQSQNRPVQNEINSQAAEACRLRAARRAGCASEDAPGVRRKTRRLHAKRRADCAPEDAPFPRRKTRRLRAACARGPVCSFLVEAGGASKLLAGRAGGWLTVRPPQAARGEGRPPLPWQPWGVAPST